MAKPRAFISFDFDHDKEAKELFAGQSKNSKTPFSVEDWSSKKSLPKKQWKKRIKKKINKCNLLIVLVGKTMPSAKGVEKEIAMAKAQDVPFFGVYIDGANSSSNLPKGLSRKKVVKWKWKKIAKEIKKMMKKGKNKAVKK